MKIRFKLKRISIIGLGITLFIIIIYFFDPLFLKFLELKSLDLKFQTRGILQPGKETVIAAIDEKSLDELGRWPWSRDIQARLVNKLTEYGARVIAFDVVFSEPDTNPGLAKIRDFKNRFKNKVPINSLKDKIVLIGPTAFGIYDLRITPFATGYPGVEIHATVIDNILHQRFLMQPEWTGLIDLLAILVCGILGAFFTTKASVFPSLGFTFFLTSTLFLPKTS